MWRSVANRSLVILLSLCPSLVALPAGADVIDASDGGFTVQRIVQIGATPDRVYRALVGEVDRWWGPTHTFFGDAANLSIEDEPGGCFCELTPEEEGVRHAVVLFAAPGRTLRMSGALGPLQPLGVSGTMTFSLAEKEDGTELVLTYAVGGYAEGGLGETWAGPVDGVLGAQIDRLRRYVETGSPSEAATGQGGSR